MVRRHERETEQLAPPATAEGAEETAAEETKAELQRRMGKARESISRTVDEIKDTVEDQYATVKATVSGILDWRETFQSEPLLWSVGALAAGFALGHTLASAEKRRRPSGKRSSVEIFADSLKEDLASIGKTLPMSSLDSRFKKVLGFGLSDLFAEIGGAKGAGKPKHVRRKTISRRKASRVRVVR
jgi:hypothetical protein